MEKLSIVSQRVKGVILSLFLSGIVTTAGLMILALVVLKASPNPGVIQAGIYAIYVISTFTGGLILAGRNKKRRLLWGILAGMSYDLILMILSCCMYSARVSDPLYTLKVFFFCVMGGAIGGFVSAHE